MKQTMAMLLAIVLILVCFTSAEEAWEAWICPGCGRENFYFYCGECGTAKPQEPTATVDVEGVYSVRPIGDSGTVYGYTSTESGYRYTTVNSHEWEMPLIETNGNWYTVWYSDPHFSNAMYVRNDEFEIIEYDEAIYINREWLENMGFEVPTTLEELQEVLLCFREYDPDGNGINEQIPLIYDIWTQENFTLKGYTPWGIVDNQHNHMMIDSDGKVFFVPMTDAYHNGLKYWSAAYKENLIWIAALGGGITQDEDFRWLFRVNNDMPCGAFIDNAGKRGLYEPVYVCVELNRLGENGGGFLGTSGLIFAKELMFTADEEKELHKLQKNIYEMVYEYEDAFIQGRLEISDSDTWSFYLTALKEMGVDRLVEIYQTAYDRSKG